MAVPGAGADANNAASPRLTVWTAVTASVVLNGAAVWWYARAGFRPGILVLWLSSMILAGYLLWSVRKSEPRTIAARDGAILAGLLLALAPVYLLQLRLIPWQINTDEITVMFFVRHHLTTDRDLFGLSPYFQFPSMIFIVWGALARWLGGIALPTVRLIHAVCGLAIVAAAYVWLRSGWPRWLAAAGAIILGANHSLVAISRMAMRDNTALLVELAAWALLQRGLVRGCPWHSCLGGIVAGFGAYTYYPARAALAVWMAFLAALLVIGRRLVPPRRVLGHGAMALLGVALAVSPLVVTMAKTPNNGTQFSREQSLLFPEGREIQRKWVYAKTVSDGVKVNILRGLTLFSNRDTDLSTMYVNPGAGFFDPVGGALVWIGLPLLLIRLRRFTDERRLADAFGLTALVTLWALFTFVVNKTPNFTRLLVILPGATYAALAAIDGIAALAQRLLERGRRMAEFARPAAIALATLLVVWSNARLYAAYAVRGLAQGEVVGSTARFIEARAHIPGYHWALAADTEYPYYWSPEPGHWRDWIGWFAGPGQSVEILSPATAGTVTLARPFTLFMSGTCWERLRRTLLPTYPGLTVDPLVADGSRVALTVE